MASISKLNLSKYYDKEKLEKLSNNVTNRIPFNRFPQLRIRYIILGAVACVVLWSTCGSSSDSSSTSDSGVGGSYDVCFKPKSRKSILV